MTHGSVSGDRVEMQEALRLSTPAARIERVYREAGGTLWRSLYAFTGGRRDITEEAMAEAFARALVHMDSIRDPAAWVFRTAHRLALRELRRERRSAPWVVRVESRPDESFPEVIAALRRLPPMQRSAMVLHYEADLPVREIASLLGISPATVKVHLFRARRRLRALLGDEEGGND